MAMPIVNTPTFPHKITLEEIPIGAEAHGSIEKVRTYQITTVTVDGNMQHRQRVQQQKAYHVPYDPKSEAQLARRQVFRDGKNSWNALSEEDKETWRQTAEDWGYHSGYALFMSLYLLSH